MLNLRSVSTRSKTLIPAWAFISLATNGLLMLTTILLLNRDRWLPVRFQSSDSTSQMQTPPDLSTSLMSKTLAPQPTLGQRHQLSYQQWVALLGREAEVIAANKPPNLTVLAGDSLSLWFPPELLPSDAPSGTRGDRTWLNQGISGDTSAGLLNRLYVFDQTEPSTIFVMIGINDLLRGGKDQTILANQRRIIRYLRRVHPQAEIVIQSILPHSGARSTFRARDRLSEVPNSRIRKINQQLEAIARSEGVNYLNLYPLFGNSQGDLQLDLTTDGLHLNSQGYLVWRSALVLFMGLQLEPANAKIN